MYPFFYQVHKLPSFGGPIFHPYHLLRSEPEKIQRNPVFSQGVAKFVRFHPAVPWRFEKKKDGFLKEKRTDAREVNLGNL